MTSGRCPSRTEIVRLFEGALPETKKKELLDHALACRDCRTVFEALIEIQSRGQDILKDLEGLGLGDGEVRARLRSQAQSELRTLRAGRRMGAPMRRWLAIPAAGSVLAVLLAFVVLPGLKSRQAPVAERNTGGVEIGLLAPRPAGPSTPLTFSWTGIPAAREYRLDIYDQTLEPVHRSRPLRETRYALPAEAAATLSPGTLYFWKVDATLENGRTVGSEFGKLLLQK